MTKTWFTHTSILAVCGAALLHGCGGGGGGGSGGSGGGPPPAINGAPSANAGPDQSVVESMSVQLVGQGADPEGSVLTYMWSQVSGPIVAFQDLSDPGTSIDLPRISVFDTDPVVLSLRVADPQGASATDEVNIILVSQDIIVFEALEGNDFTEELYKYAPESGVVTTVSGPLQGSEDVIDYSISPDGKWLAYRAYQEATTTNELFVVSMDNGSVKKINGPLQTDGVVLEYAWSPDSSQIAYTADADIDRINEVYVASPDGSGLRKVSGDVGNPPRYERRRIAWSPDGRYLACLLLDRTTSDQVFIEVHDTLAGVANSVWVNPPLVANGEILSIFYWAPDSSRIAYLADQEVDEVFELFTVRPDASENRKVSGALAAGGRVGDFYWSPVGSQVAYRANQDSSQAELYTVQGDGSANTKVNGPLIPTGVVGQWRWSPDGSRLAYLATQESTDVELYTVRPDGGDNVKVSGALAPNSFVQEFDTIRQPWSPDGSWLAYRAYQDIDNVTQLYTVRPDGSENLRVNGALVTGGNVVNFRWSPDNSMIAYRADQDILGSYQLYSVRPDASENYWVSSSLLQNSLLEEYAWSADSSGISFIAEQGLGRGFELMLATPNGDTNLTVGGDQFMNGRIFELRWTP